MWEMVKVPSTQVITIAEYLEQGYEPFAVTSNTFNFETVWFKRNLEEVFPMIKESSSVVPEQRYEPDKGDSPKPAPKTKKKSGS